MPKTRGKTKEEFPPLVVRGDVEINNPVSYSFRFVDFGNWAIFTINEMTGEFSIQSDWGNYHYRWNINHIGKNRKLSQFLLTCDSDYVVRKFAYDNKHDLGQVTDTDATLARIRQRICEARRHGDIDDEKWHRAKDKARELWEQTDSWAAEDFRLEACQSELYNFLSEPWDYIYTMPSARFNFLKNRLLPFFFDWLKHHLTNGDAPLPKGNTVITAKVI